jgi:nucleolar protein 56
MDEHFVSTETVRHAGVNGRFVQGLGDGPHPGVLVVHGGGGARGYEQRYAAMLAEHGFSVFCVEYFGAPGVRDALVEVPLETFHNATEWLLARPRVSGDRVGVVGFSRGSEPALLTGAMFDTVGVVVAYVPSCYAWAAPSWMDGVGTNEPSWTLDGEPVPFLEIDQYITQDDAIGEPLDGGPVNACEVAIDRADSSALDRAMIPLEDIDGPVLLVSGGADTVWPSAAFGTRARDRLEDHPWRVEHCLFPDAGHTIRVPYRFDEDIDEKTEHKYGGTHAANARASARAWNRTLDFLNTALRGNHGRTDTPDTVGRR